MFIDSGFWSCFGQQVVLRIRAISLASDTTLASRDVCLPSRPTKSPCCSATRLSADWTWTPARSKFSSPSSSNKALLTPKNASPMPHFGYTQFPLYIYTQNPTHSPFRNPSLLVYTDYDFGFDPRLFDELEEPPPVHILYPRPPYNLSSGTNFHSFSVLLTAVLVAFTCR